MICPVRGSLGALVQSLHGLAMALVLVVGSLLLGAVNASAEPRETRCREKRDGGQIEFECERGRAKYRYKGTKEGYEREFERPGGRKCRERLDRGRYERHCE
jgi:hypothetical protein